MYTLLWNLFAVWLATVSSDTECPYVTTFDDRRSSPDRFRVVQYNVEWLFIDYYSPMNCPGSGCTWVNQSEANTHLDYVVDVLSKLDGDLINLCEVEGCDELTMLADRLDGSYKPYLKRGTDSSTGQNVGMLTRVDPLVNLYRTETKVSYPVTGSTCGYTGTSGTYGVSKHYITEFAVGEHKVAMIAAHLLAIPTDVTRCAEREAQATVLQSVVADYIQRGYDIIVLGDFNDYDGTVLDINNNTPRSTVLDILKGKGQEYTLYSVAELIAQQDRYTDWWDSDDNCATSSVRDFSMIDHVLVTAPIFEHISDVFIYHGYDEYCGKYNSDHYPVVVDFYV